MVIAARLPACRSRVSRLVEFMSTGELNSETCRSADPPRAVAVVHRPDAVGVWREHERPVRSRPVEAATEETLSAQIDAADDLCRLVLYGDHAEAGDLGLGCELRQHVHRALLAEVAQRGSEERDTPHGIVATELGDAVTIALEVKAHATPEPMTNPSQLRNHTAGRLGCRARAHPRHATGRRPG